MSRFCLVIAVLAFTACHTDALTDSGAPPADANEMLAEWTITEQTDWASSFSFEVVEAGHTYLLSCFAQRIGDVPPFEARTRTRPDGEIQVRWSGEFDFITFRIMDVTAGHPGTLVEEFSGEANGDFRSKAVTNLPTVVIWENHMLAKIDRPAGLSTLDCHEDRELGRSPEWAYRIIFDDRCWESQEGETVLPCPAK